MTTTDFAKFGSRERVLAEELLRAWNNKGLPDDFNDDEVTIMMNQNSGNVFLTNSDFQVAMESDGELFSFYSCPICGHEGFIEDIEGHSEDADCIEWVNDIKENA